MLTETVSSSLLLRGDLERKPMADSLMLISFDASGNMCGVKRYQPTRILKRTHITE